MCRPSIQMVMHDVVVRRGIEKIQKYSQPKLFKVYCWMPTPNVPSKVVLPVIWYTLLLATLDCANPVFLAEPMFSLQVAIQVVMTREALHTQGATQIECSVVLRHCWSIGKGYFGRLRRDIPGV